MPLKEIRVAKDTDEIAEPIDLRDRTLAGLLAWLIPGAGHFYQNRRAKAVIFLVCILGTFMYGMFLGEGRVVYAQWEDPEHRRYPFICQIAVGLPSLPAVFTAMTDRQTFLGTKWYVPPSIRGDNTELDELHRRLNRRFELGTVFTMIAGLLNVLAIYDAVCGPVYRVAQSAKSKNEQQTSEKSETRTETTSSHS